MVPLLISGKYFYYIKPNNRLIILDGTSYKQVGKSKDIKSNTNFTINLELLQIAYGGNSVSLFDISEILNVENKDKFKLKINPNPVQDQLNISFQLEKPEQVELFITDILGNRIDLVQSGLQSNLNQTINNPISYLPSGAYFLTLSAGDVNESLKFVVE